FLLSVLLTDKRRWLLNRHFYTAMFIGLLICLPNFLWQYRHHFPVIHHMGLLTKQQLQYNSRIDFITDQFLIALPSFFIWLGGLLFILFHREGRKYLAVAIIYFAIMAQLLYFNGKGYYGAAAYPTLMAFGGIWLSRVVVLRGFGWLRWTAPAFMLVLLLLFLPILVPFMSPDKLAGFYVSAHLENNGFMRWEDRRQHALPQDFADMLGWKEMAEKTAKVYNALPDSVKKKTMVYGDNYGEAGALAFYGHRLGLPEIYSDNASYVFWLPDQFTQKYFLFVTDDLPPPDDLFFNHWRKREIIDSVRQPLAREYRTKIILYSNPDDSVRIIAEKNLLKDKRQFGME
ncbi:MAG: hypothetical protein JO301_14260, partial [Chitinophagaceae bacterium]|nr:hypothetical protein [Chitinophagaceae bacterium]